MQHLLEMRIPEVTANLLRRFQGCFVSLSCDKFASNVVEKFFVESGESYSASIIMELLRSPDASMLLVDPFGNFVIQSALSVSSVRYSTLFQLGICSSMICCGLVRSMLGCLVLHDFKSLSLDLN